MEDTMPRFISWMRCAGLLGGLLSFAHAGAALAEAANAAISNGLKSPPAEQRVALVIGNSNYQTAPQLANPNNDARSVAQLLNSAGFEVTVATDQTRNDMVRGLQDFSNKVADHGPNTVAMVYYAGHGVQLAGENYLVPIDARIAAPSDLPDNTVRLVDVMGTLETIPSRMRIVVLDACRNNPFPNVDDAGRGLAIVDAPSGSIVGYSTAPGMEAQDGDGNHSPYTSAFLNVARQPNLPIEQLFKRVRLEVNNTTAGRQTPWESSSLTSDFYFFGDTAVASAGAPDRSPIIQTASNFPSRSVQQAYDYVLSEGSPEYYEEFIRLYPHDPLCDRIRFLLGNLLQAAAWHRAVIANSPFAYKTFYDNYANSPYAKVALKLQAQPKAVPLMQFTHLAKQSPTFKAGNPVLSGPTSGIKPNNPSGGATGLIRFMPAPNHTGTNTPPSDPKKIVTLPAKGTTTGTTLGTATGTGAGSPANGDNNGKVTKLSTRINSNPIRVVNKPVVTTTPRKFGGGFGGGNSSPRIATTQSRGSFGGNGGFKR